MQKCEWQYCEGHLGKFSSCRDEAIYNSTMDGFDESTGDCEFEGHYTLVIVDGPQSVTVSFDAPEFTIPPGAYLVRVDNSGFVDVTEGTAAELREIFDRAESAYAEWLGEEE